MKDRQLPKSIRSTLWSYDMNGISLERDREIIITQGLNYGTLESIKWLLSTYGETEIKKVIRHPKKGMWWRKTLNFWTLILNVKIPETSFEKATIKIKPDFAISR